VTDTNEPTRPELLPAVREEPPKPAPKRSAKARKRRPTARKRPPVRASTKTRILPTPRISFLKQIDLLRAFATVSAERGGRPVANDEAASVVGMAPSTISLANPFFVDIGLLEKVDGRFLPAPAVANFARVYRWDADKAPRELASLLRSTWFAQTLLPRLAYAPLSERDALTELDKEATAGPEYRPQLRTLLDYLEVVGLVTRNGDMIQRADVDQRAAVVAAPDERAAEPEFQPSPDPSTGQHPFIAGLLRELPPIGGGWTAAKRDKWLEMAKLTVDMIYDVEQPANAPEPTQPRRDDSVVAIQE
jgi:hypothetical protein